MIRIPEELLEQIERGNVLLFVGERIVRDAEGRAVTDLLAAALAARTEGVDPDDATFPEAAQAYEDSAGRQALIQFVRDQLDALGDTPLPTHRLIAGLASCNLLVTTCIDRRLERAFADAGRPLAVITAGLDVAFEDERKARLYRLRGSIERIESLVLTDDDYEIFFEDQSSISVVLQGYLARKTILFVGYDLADPHFKRLYRKVTAPLDDFARRAYAFSAELDPKVARWCERHGINVIAVDATVLLETLASQLASRSRPAPSTPPEANQQSALPLPAHPYKLLDYYEASDTAIFFGRREETQTLSALVHGHRLVLVYGASGVGKTSLLLAGAVPRLEAADPPYHAIYVRALGDPAQIIRETLQRELPDAELPTNSTLVNFLAAATRATGHTLVIVLDQFEEFFIRLSPQFREAFVAELGALYDARDVPVKVVLSLREDWLASVNEFRARIPTMFHNDQRVLPLTRDQARQAITAPVERLGVSYEPALVERLLDDLVGTIGAEVMPPQLQLVCSALYDRLGPNERIITLTAYERLDGARGVLRDYLDEQLIRLGHDERTLARGALEELVTSQGTKAVKTGDELALGLEVDSAKLLPVLETLVQSRLLRVLERNDGARAFELAHEYLIREIGVGEEARERKEVEELISQEVENWQRFQTLLGGDKLARIDEVRELLRLGPEAQELLLRSALQVGYDTDYWLNRVVDLERRAAVLAETTGSKLAVVRQRAAEVLATQDTPESVEPLLVLALHDQDMFARTTARASLAKLSAQRPLIVARLHSELKSADRRLRQAVLRTMAVLPLRELPANVRAPVLATRARLRTTWLAEQSVATPLRRALVLTAGLLLAVLALAYVVSINSYVVTINNSPISRDLDSLVINRGNPWIPLPERLDIDTGVSASQIAITARGKIVDRSIWGFWIQNSAVGYRYWGEQVAAALRPDGRVPMHWYLGQPDQAIDDLLNATGAGDPESRLWVAQALGQIGKVNPTLADTRVISMLRTLAQDQDASQARARDTRIEATRSLAEVVKVNSELASESAAALWPLVSDKDSVVRTNALSSLQLVVGLDPKLATPDRVVTLTTSLQIPGRDSPERIAIIQFLRAVAATNPTRAAQIVSALAMHLQDTNADVRQTTQAGLDDIVRNNPALAASDQIVVFRAILQDSSSLDNARAYAADLLAAMAELNPALATPDLVKVLRARLQDSPAEVRVHSLSALSNVLRSNPTLATSDLIDTLGVLLEDHDTTISLQASDILRTLAHSNPALATPDLVKPFVAQLQNSDLKVRLNALKEIGSRLGMAAPWGAPDFMAILRPMLQDSDRSVRFAALDTLKQALRINSNLAGSDVVFALLPLLSDSDKRLRSSAADALKLALAANHALATPELVTILRPSLEDENPDVRAQTAQLLAALAAADPAQAAQLLAVLHSHLGDPSSTVRVALPLSIIEAAHSDPSLADETVGTLALLLQDKDRSVRFEAAKALPVVVADPAQAAVIVADLRALLHSYDPGVRAAVASSLGRAGASDGAQAAAVLTELRPLVQDPVVTVRRAAVLALGRIGSAQVAQAADVLAELGPLVQNQRDSAWNATVDALEQIGTADPARAADVLRVLRPLLDDSNTDVDMRRSIIGTVGLIGSAHSAQAADALAALGPFLRENQPSAIRITAVRALRKIGDAQPADVLPLLRSLLQDNHSDVRLEAASALKPIIEEHATLATADTVGALRAILNDEDTYVHLMQSTGLSWTVGRPPGMTPAEFAALLRSLLERPDQNLRAMAAAALGQAASNNLNLGAEAMTGLRRLLQDPNSSERARYYAIGALIQIGTAQRALTAEVVATLRELLGDPDSDIRATAAAALGQILSNNLDLASATAPNESGERIPTEPGEPTLRNLGNPALATPEVAADLSRLLTDEDADTRAAAAYALWRAVVINPTLAKGEFATALVPLLDDLDGDARAAISGLLGQIGAANPALVNEVAGALRALPAGQRNSADPATTQALGRFRPPKLVLADADAVAVLRALLQSPETGEVHAYAAYTLSRLNVARQILPKPTLAATMQMALKDSNPVVRSIAIETIQRTLTLSPTLATPALAIDLQTLVAHDSESAVRAGALQGLAKLIAANPTPATPALVQALQAALQDSDANVRFYAVVLLSQVGRSNPALAANSFAAVQSLVHDQPAYVYSAVAGALGQLGSADRALTEQAITSLRPLLQASGHDVQFIAAQALRQLMIVNPAAATADLVADLQTSMSPTNIIRADAVDILGLIGSNNPVLAPGIVDNLLALQDQDEDMRARTMMALGAIGAANQTLAPKIAEALKGALQAELAKKNSSRSVMVTTALVPLLTAHQALVADVTATLTALLTNQLDDAVRVPTVMALGPLGATDPAAAQQVAAVLIPLQSGNTDLKAAIATALGKLAAANATLVPIVSPRLIELLGDSQSSVGSSAANALKEMLIGTPTAAKEVVDQLLLRLKEGSSRRYFYFVPGALLQVTETNPEVATQVAEELIRLLKNPTLDKRGHLVAASNLLQVVALDSEHQSQRLADIIPELLRDQDKDVVLAVTDTIPTLEGIRALATPQVNAELIDLLGDDNNPELRKSALMALNQLVKANSALAPDIISILPTRLQDTSETFRLQAIDSLRQLIRSDSTLVTPALATEIAALLRDKDDQFRVYAATILSSAIQIRPALAQPDLVSALIAHVQERDSNGRADALEVLVKLLETNPALATDDLMKALMPLIQDRDERVRSVGLQSVLGAIVANHKLATAGIVEMLRTFLQDQDHGVRATAAVALGHVYATQKIEQIITDDFLFALLTDPTNHQERSVAVRAFVLIHLNNQSLSQTLHSGLLSRIGDVDPIARIWANRAATSIKMADLAYSASVLKAAQRSVVKNTLQKLSNITPTSGANLLGDDYSQAASEGLNWLAQQEAKDKADQTEIGP